MHISELVHRLSTHQQLNLPKGRTTPYVSELLEPCTILTANIIPVKTSKINKRLSLSLT